MNSTANALLRAKGQSGLTMFGFLMLLIVLAIGLNFVLTLGPHFMDNRAIVNVVETISPSIWTGSSKRKMYEAVDKGLKVNSIRGLKSEEIIKIEKTKSGTEVKIDYEVRENMLGNMDAVLVFDKTFTYR